MGFDAKRNIYESLPLPIKRIVYLIPFSWWAGNAYRKIFRNGSRFDRANREELLEYQKSKLKAVLLYAADQVPAYRHLKGIVKRLEPFEALKAFPFLDKDTLQRNFQDYLPCDFNKIPHYEATTGGTSGNQLKFFLDDSSPAVELGFMHRQWRRVGYTPRRRKAVFRGVTFPNRKPGVFWQHNPIYNELQFSPFHMNEDNLGAYCEQIARYRPSYLHGYPSAVDVLAEYVLRRGLTDEMPKDRSGVAGVGRNHQRPAGTDRTGVPDAGLFLVWTQRTRRAGRGMRTKQRLPSLSRLRLSGNRRRRGPRMHPGRRSGRNRRNGILQPVHALDPLPFGRLCRALGIRMRMRALLGPFYRRGRPMETGHGRRRERRKDFHRGVEHARTFVRKGRALSILPGHSGRVRIENHGCLGVYGTGSQDDRDGV